MSRWLNNLSAKGRFGSFHDLSVVGKQASSPEQLSAQGMVRDSVVTPDSNSFSIERENSTSLRSFMYGLPVCMITCVPESSILRLRLSPLLGSLSGEVVDAVDVFGLEAPVGPGS